MIACRQASDPARCPPELSEGFADVFAATSTVSSVKAVLAGKHLTKAELRQPAGQRAITSFFRQPSETKDKSTKPTLASLSSAPAWKSVKAPQQPVSTVASSSPDSFPTLNGSYKPRLAAPEFIMQPSASMRPALPTANVSVPPASLAPNTPSHRYEMTVALSEQVGDTFEMVPGWSCAVCTYINPKAMALACEACGQMRGSSNPHLNHDSPSFVATQDDIEPNYDATASEFRPQEQAYSQDSVLVSRMECIATGL